MSDSEIWFHSWEQWVCIVPLDDRKYRPLAIVPDYIEPEAAVDPEAWKDLADCRGTSPALFFLEGDPGECANTAKYAKSFCKTCPVRVECLAYAVDNHIEHGVWGGTTPRQRQKIRAQQRTDGAA
jgi:WhiB family redox-sensing transcriptional regulator